MKSARRFAGIAFDTPPARILVLLSMDADRPGVAELGTEQSRRSFGPTELVILKPRT